jgi:hypothetical protein
MLKNNEPGVGMQLKLFQIHENNEAQMENKNS